jgi:flagellar basal body L-ring protein FlgH
MSYYANDFRSDKGQNYAAWKTHKANLFRTYRTITVKADNITITFENDQKAEITFRQDYRSDWTRDIGLKTLNLVKQEGRWLILGESWVAGN